MTGRPVLSIFSGRKSSVNPFLHMGIILKRTECPYCTLLDICDTKVEINASNTVKLFVRKRHVVENALL